MYENLLLLFTQDKCKNSHDQENIELSTMPSTSQEHDQTAENFISTESIGDENKEDEGFTTQQLFSFAWQIARGMVTIFLFSKILNKHTIRIF